MYSTACIHILHVRIHVHVKYCMYSHITCEDSCTYMYSTACMYPHTTHGDLCTCTVLCMHPHTTSRFIHTGLHLEFLSDCLKVSLEICMKLCHLI